MDAPPVNFHPPGFQDVIEEPSPPPFTPPTPLGVRYLFGRVNQGYNEAFMLLTINLGGGWPIAEVIQGFNLQGNLDWVIMDCISEVEAQVAWDRLLVAGWGQLGFNSITGFPDL